MFPPQDMAAIDRPNEGRAFTLIDIYLKKVRNTYEVQRPVSGRRASDCVSPSIAALTWELPCYNPDQMPHRKVLVLSYLDGHGDRVPGNANEHSWWAYHSRDGWEEAGYTCGNRH